VPFEFEFQLLAYFILPPRHNFDFILPFSFIMAQQTGYNAYLCTYVFRHKSCLLEIKGIFRKDKLFYRWLNKNILEQGHIGNFKKT